MLRDRAENRNVINVEKITKTARKSRVIRINYELIRYERIGKSLRNYSAICYRFVIEKCLIDFYSAIALSLVSCILKTKLNNCNDDIIYYSLYQN